MTDSVRNVISSNKPSDKPYPLFGDIPFGQLFRYVNPWCENNIYMRLRSNNDGLLRYSSVHLNTGDVYIVQVDRQVTLVAPEEQVIISSPKVV